MRLHGEVRPKAEILRLNGVSMSKFIEIAKENGKIEKLNQGKQGASELMNNSIKELKSQLTDYEIAINKDKGYYKR